MLSVVIPCYNEQETLSILLERVTKICHQEYGADYEVILVDDGSTDSTWPQMLEHSELNLNITAVRLTRNFGHQLALSAGLDIAGGEHIFILDADLQDPPELLTKMRAMIEDGADIVYGRRTERQGESIFKKVSARLFYRLLQSMIDIQVPLDTGDFRLMNKKALKMFRRMPEQHRFVRGMVSWVGLDQRPLDYIRDKRYAGETKYTFRKMIQLALDAVTGFSTKPLRIASYLGLIFAMLSLAGIGYTLWSWLFLNTVSGWTSLMTTILTLSSVQLLVLGVMGEYMGRMFTEIKRRPMYLVDQIASKGRAGDEETDHTLQHSNKRKSVA